MSTLKNVLCNYFCSKVESMRNSIINNIDKNLKDGKSSSKKDNIKDYYSLVVKEELSDNFILNDYMEKVHDIDEEENDNEDEKEDILEEMQEDRKGDIQEDKMEKESILRGLNNIGATCYMNATLQCLSNSEDLTNYFLKKYPNEPNFDKNKISYEYYKVVQNLWDKNNNNKPYSPNDFKEKISEENPLFAGIAANDSKDLIIFLLERLHKELNANKNVNIIIKLFN